MKTVRSRCGWLAGLAVAAMFTAPGLEAQTTTMPSTQRYGSGLLDIPVASVLPHMAITGTFSGFFIDMPRTVVTNDEGRIVGFGPALDEFYGDGSIALGLFDRVEIGTTIQALQDDGEGGNTWGLFGRLALLKPETSGIGVAVGTRYIFDGPDFGERNYEPTRIGINDPRFWENYPGRTDTTEDINTELSAYAVGTAHLRGWDSGPLPQHDITLSLGWGSGMFREGDFLEYYRFADGDGFFAGSAVHFALGESSLLHIMGEYNGFDVNLGAQLDLSGIRIGANYLAANYDEPAGGYYSEYRTPKFGVLGSLCIGGGGLCDATLMERPAPEIVQLPAPAPDTVTITREVAPPLPDGTPATICLATGETVQIRVTAQGDTLVGPARVSVRSLRPGIVFAGTYAQGRSWYENDEPITFERRIYNQSGNPVRLNCPDLVRVGEYMGVPLFAMRNADRPYQTLYVPVSPGLWQRYEFGMQQTRG